MNDVFIILITFAKPACSTFKDEQKYAIFLADTNEYKSSNEPSFTFLSKHKSTPSTCE